MIKIIGIIYVLVMFGCFIEAYFYTELDPESKKFLEERERLRNEEAKKE